MKISSLFLHDLGVAAIEYALIGALIAAVIATTVGLMGAEVIGLYQSICTAISTATGAGAC